MLSYGPCQTPTLYFCVERHKQIQNFVSVQWRRPFFEYQGIEFFATQADESGRAHFPPGGTARVVSVAEEWKYVKKVPGLNTV